MARVECECKTDETHIYDAERIHGNAVAECGGLLEYFDRLGDVLLDAVGLLVSVTW